MDLSSADSVRSFLRICLDQGPGRKRTPLQLADILTSGHDGSFLGPVYKALVSYAPHLKRLNDAAEQQGENALAAKRKHTTARRAFADALAAWIRGETPEPTSSERADGPRRYQMRNTKVDAIRFALGGDAGRAVSEFLIDVAHTLIHDAGGAFLVLDPGTPFHKRVDVGDWLVKDHRRRVTAYTEYEFTEEYDLADTLAPLRCPQNRIGDKAEEGHHSFRTNDAGAWRCVFCDAPALWGGQPEIPPRPRAYVFNSRSVNRSTKHATDGDGHTLCPSRFEASAPMRTEEAARLPLCGGCYRALTDEPDQP